MGNNRNGSTYSAQLDGSGQGRGNTRARPGRPLSIKAYLEDARVSPYYWRSVPTTFDMNSEPELIQSNVSRVEPLPKGGKRNISVPVQKMVQRIQGRRMINMPKPLAGGYDLLITHQEASRPKEGTGNLARFGKGRKSSIKQFKTSLKTPKKKKPEDLRRNRKVPGTIKEMGKENTIGTDLTHKGTRLPNLSLYPWKACSICPGLLLSSQRRNKKGSIGSFHTNDG
ncbi:hypothetical protein O181_013647 [Austropuccinia psidii MF-1]|uniref:Uncharacterized protein n=1 Tax=Austropuccinia psidii MF-1 TaxID=1389203 RepID=A0A9Q3BYQ8_9BASI|nr:hypothetical protein [Austropuccinia psidii MF-1]